MEQETENPYQELVNDHIGGQTEVKETKEEKTEPKVKETKEELKEQTPEDNLLTEEDVKELGLSKTFIGKDKYTTLKEVYQNAIKWDTKLAQQVSDLQKKMTGLEEALSKKEVKEVVKEVEEQLPDYEAEMEKFIDNDGYVVDKKGLATFNKKYFELREKLLKKEFQKSLDDKTKEIDEKYSKTGQSVQQLQAEKYQSELYDEIADGLKGIYEEVTPEMIDKAMKEYGKMLSEEDEETQKLYGNIYSNKPKKLAKDILSYHKANRKVEEKTDAEKIADKAHEKQIEKLKVSDKKLTKVSTSARDKEVKVEDKDYDELIKEAEEDAKNYANSFGGGET